VGAVTPEAKVKAKLREFLKTLDPAPYVVTPIGSAYGAAGVPDLLICHSARGDLGLMIGIEVKADATKKPTPLQRRNLEMIRAAGGVAFVVHGENLTQLIALWHANCCWRNIGALMNGESV
jgi:hypothetical protein